MKVAIQGCCHGELDVLYETLANQSINLLIICGDFQCLRSTVDLPSLACPPKYRRLGNFYEYYSGLKEAPFPTLFIGGNHEASSYLWELFHGGFVAHNIYFLGFAGVVKFGGLRIGGVSGIYKDHHYNMGYYEKHPLNEDDCRSIYHTRRFNIYRLSQVSLPCFTKD
jgi:lariat debranching enzyme